MNINHILQKNVHGVNSQLLRAFQEYFTNTSCEPCDIELLHLLENTPLMPPDNYHQASVLYMVIHNLRFLQAEHPHDALPKKLLLQLEKEFEEQHRKNIENYINNKEIYISVKIVAALTGTEDMFPELYDKHFAITNLAAHPVILAHQQLHASFSDTIYNQYSDIFSIETLDDDGAFNKELLTYGNILHQHTYEFEHYKRIFMHHIEQWRSDIATVVYNRFLDNAYSTTNIIAFSGWLDYNPGALKEEILEKLTQQHLEHIAGTPVHDYNTHLVKFLGIHHTNFDESYFMALMKKDLNFDVLVSPLNSNSFRDFLQQYAQNNVYMQDVLPSILSKLNYQHLQQKLGSKNNAHRMKL